MFVKLYRGLKEILIRVESVAYLEQSADGTTVHFTGASVEVDCAPQEVADDLDLAE